MAGRDVRHQIGATSPLSAAEIRPQTSVAVYWPLGPGVPNEPLAAKVIRIDTRKRQADVRAMIGRSERELTCVPFEALFAPGTVLHDERRG